MELAMEGLERNGYDDWSRQNERMKWIGKLCEGRDDRAMDWFIFRVM